MTGKKALSEYDFTKFPRISIGDLFDGSMIERLETQQKRTTIEKSEADNIAKKKKLKSLVNQNIWLPSSNK